MPRRERLAFVDEWKTLWKPDWDALGGYSGSTCDPTRVDPKVVEWAKANCSHNPHFIKIINNNAANDRSSLGYSSKINTKLTVPKPFVKEHFRALKRVVRLENEEGKTWKVSFGEISSHPCWQQGWRRLALDHDLKPGQVMVFVLVGDSWFRFTRFDEDGNLLSLKSSSTHSPLNDVASSAEQKHGSVLRNPEYSLHEIRASWKAKRAECGPTTTTTTTTQPHSSLEFDGAPSQLLAPAHKKLAEAPFKRRRLRKVGEIMSKANSNGGSHLAINSEHCSQESEEAGSRVMADSPSTVTVVS